MKETDLFKPVKAWLEEREYEVYSEVESKFTGGRADIVAVNGPAVTVVELKTSLSLELIGQAIRWKPFANYVYIAVPYSINRSEYGRKLLKREGIGFLEVDFKSWNIQVYNYVKAKFNRRVNDHLRESLVEQHKELPGGHAGGGYVTPYKLTIDRVKQFLRGVRSNDGWVTIEEILNYCETHYATPKPSLSKALREFEYEWCECKKENGRLYFRFRNGL